MSIRGSMVLLEWFRLKLVDLSHRSSQRSIAISDKPLRFSSSG